MNATALYTGGSHASGNDIPVTVVDTGEKIRVEGGEFSVCAAAMLNDEPLEFVNKTALEILQAIHTRNSCKFEQGKEHGGNHIVCKYAVLDPAKRNLTGTVKEIFDILQREKQCRLSNQYSVDRSQWLESLKKKYGMGGIIDCRPCAMKHGEYGDGGPVTVGKYYTHPRFGTGKVISADNEKATIDFGGDVGSKFLLLRFAKLTEVGQNETPILTTGVTASTKSESETTKIEQKPDTKKKEKKVLPTSILGKVLAAQDTIKAMTTTKQLRDWAISNGMDNRAAFPRFKIALNEIGMDYDAIKQGIQAAAAEKLESQVTHEVTLYCDAKASHNMFGITDKDGDVLWYGKFYGDENGNYDGEQSSGELAAALKAVWLASKIKEAAGIPAIRLNLIIDAQWLTYQDHAGQKGYALTVSAKRLNVQLNVEWISGKENPADEWTTASGYKKWSDNNLASLAEPIKSETEIEAIKAKAQEEHKLIEEVKVLEGPLVTLEFCSIKKESDKAVQVEFKIRSQKGLESIELWLPKAVSKIEGNKISVTESFWEEKKKELTQRYGNIRIRSFRRIMEKENSIGILVTVAEYVSDQAIGRWMWFPKSQIISHDENELIVTSWIFLKKKEQVEEEASNMQFTAHLEVNAETILPELLPCNTPDIPIIEVSETEVEKGEEFKSPEYKIAYGKVKELILRLKQARQMADGGRISNLTPAQAKLVRTPEFKAWFGDWEHDPANASNVVDENGEPMVCYHGTASDFTIFRSGKMTRGIFFSNRIETAKRFSEGDLKREGERPKIIAVFLNIRKPYYKEKTLDKAMSDSYWTKYFEERPFITKKSQKAILKENRFGDDLMSFGIISEEPRNKIIEYGYDGLIFPADNNSTTHVAFYPSQIKLADGTNTTFDPNNPDIRYADGGGISNLTPAQAKLVRTPEFKAWFGDWEHDPANASKVVDENGEPLIVWHGSDAHFNIFKKTSDGDLKYFYFAKNKEYSAGFATAFKRPNLRPYFLNIRKVFDGKKFGTNEYPEQTFFSLMNIKPKPRKFQRFNKLTGDAETVIEPLGEIKFWEVLHDYYDDGVYEYFVGAGYDGFMFYEDNEVADFSDGDINSKKKKIISTLAFACIKPNQIKLANGTNHKFNPNNPDIRYADGGPVCGCQHKMGDGGPVPTEAYLLTYKKNGQTVTIDLSKYSDEDIKAEYEEEKMLNDKRVKGIASLEEQLKNFKGSILSKEYKDLEDTLKRTKSQLAITNEKILPFYERIIYSDGGPIPFDGRIKKIKSKAKEAAGIAIYYKDKILLAHPTNAPWYGTYSIPKGGMEQGETPKDTAIRELEEETGIVVGAGFGNDLGEPFLIEKVKDGKVQRKLHYFKLIINDLTEIGLPDDLAITESKHGVIDIPKKQLQIEEVDWAGFVPLKDAEKRMAKYQLPLLENGNNDGNNVFPLSDAQYSDKLLAEQKVRTLIQLLNYKILIPAPGRGMVTKEDAFINDIAGEIYFGKEFHSKADPERTAKTKYGFTDKQKVKELTEYAILKVGRVIVRKYEYDVPEAYSRIVGLYNVQPYSTHRTSLSQELQQFSTPIPMAYLMGVFCGDGANNKILLEPTAGNGFLTISGSPENFIVNEIDRNRFNNLQKDNYKLKLNQDALKPFPIPLNSVDGVIANPPFGAPHDGYVIDRFHITGLEQKIIANALNYVKDDSRSAFIIGGWTEFTDKGTLKTFRDKNFFGYLWHSFNVVDVIQVSGDLYGKQGTVYPIRIILLGGRKTTKGGFYPLRDFNKDVLSEFSPHPVMNFEDLYKRFKIHL